MERVDEAQQQREAPPAAAHCGVVLISADIHSLSVVLTVYYYVKLLRQPWDAPHPVETISSLFFTQFYGLSAQHFREASLTFLNNLIRKHLNYTSEC